jgi:hypothetical protein
VELKGTIATGSTNTTAKTFRINGLTVNYGSAAVQGVPADGQTVEVNGTFGQYNSATHTLTATKVEPKTEMEPSENEHVDVEGYVTNLDAGAMTFTVSGISVSAAGATITGSGTTITNGSIVEAEGTMVNGVLIASKVTLKTSL